MIDRLVRSLHLSQLRHYSSARVGSTLLINMVDVSLFFLYRNIYGLDDIQTGVAIAIAKIAVGIFSLLLGVLNDNTPLFIQRKIGSNKFWLVLGSPALSVTYILLFLPPEGLDQTFLFRWLLTFNVLFHLFYAFVSVSYLSWMPKITRTEERTKVSKYQNIWNSVGALLATLSFVIVTGIHENNPVQAILLLRIVIFSYAAVQVIVFYSVIRSIPSTLGEELPVPSLKSQVSIFVRDRNFVIWVIIYGIFSIGLFMLTTLLLDIITIVLRLETTLDLAIFGIGFTVFTVVGFFIWETYEKRLGEKTKPLRHSMVMSVLVLISLAVVTIDESNLVITLLFSLLLGIGISSYFLLPVAILADMVEFAEMGWYQENLTSVSIAGTFNGFARISLNFIQSIGGYIAGVVAAFELYRFSGVVASIFLVIAFLLLRFVRIDVLSKETSQS